MTEPPTPTDHADCPAFLARHAADQQGLDITVHTTPDLDSPYTVDPFVCPHGTPFWILPTPAQVERWRQDDTDD